MGLLAMSKYYTAFIFDENGTVHCTHKYLGELTENYYDDIISDITHYFEETAREMPCLLFDQRQWFGKNGDIAVLTLNPEEVWKPHMMLDLRDRLSRYREDDYDSYKPHVTTSAVREWRPFRYYALMTGKTVIRIWT